MASTAMYARLCPLSKCGGAGGEIRTHTDLRPETCQVSVSTSSTTPALLIQIDGHWDDGHGHRQTPPEPRWHSSAGIGDFGNQISSIGCKKTHAVLPSPPSPVSRRSRRLGGRGGRLNRFPGIPVSLPMKSVIVLVQVGRSGKERPESLSPQQKSRGDHSPRLLGVADGHTESWQVMKLTLGNCQ